MQTNFTPEQLKNPDMAASEQVLRTCVHCGFCTATCPTYTLLGDELDSPRGRIYLIKDMLENDKPANKEVVTHVDRCLSCLSCMSTCPSGVNYMHLVDHARKHIEETYDRPLIDKGLRALLATVLPSPRLFKVSLLFAGMAKPFAGLFPARLKAMLQLAPTRLPVASPFDKPGVTPAEGQKKYRVAVLPGCAQKVLQPSINEATLRLLTRHGAEVVYPENTGCCGSLVHHMGKSDRAHAQAKVMIDAWHRDTKEGGGKGLDAIVINASGCGTTIKDYGFMFRNDPDYAEKAELISSLAKDVTEFLFDVGLMPSVVETGQRIAYHSACSMQHGQKITTQPKDLLKAAGFKVQDVPQGHLCCGSAGTYNILQPEISAKLLENKVANIEKTRPEFIATGNIGCITQIGQGTNIPIVHTVEVLDWTSGGPKPEGI
jgi:glycolate oxidase iron-sulfur subunit